VHDVGVQPSRSDPGVGLLVFLVTAVFGIQMDLTDELTPLLYILQVRGFLLFMSANNTALSLSYKRFLFSNAKHAMKIRDDCTSVNLF
jgi:hypothetical protein